MGGNGAAYGVRRTYMLSGILSREECAKCRICCCFDDTDLWEAPVMTDELAESLKDTQFEYLENGKRILKMPKEVIDGEELYCCTLLDKNAGCVLGDKKPFECSIWPLRVMQLDGRRVIALSPVCPVLQTRAVKDIADVAQKLSKKIFAQADKNPDIVKKYEPGYVIFVIEGIS